MACDIKGNLEPQKCFEIIKKKLQSGYFVTEIVPIKNKLIGYLGLYYYIKGRKLDANSDVKLFLKIMPFQGTRQKKFIEESGVFQIETGIYSLVFPKIFRTSDKITPRCILVMDSFIVLEDMTSKGFEMANKYIPLDFWQCKIVLQTLAKFHARSIIFEKRNKQNLFEFLQKRKIHLHTPDILMQEAIKTNIEGLTSIIDFIKKDFDDKEGCWEKVIKKIKEEGARYYATAKFSDNLLRVLCHSDLWSNNILFKYNSEKRAIKCCLVDFQLARYASPALDIISFLTFTTSRETRKSQFKDFMHIYYDALECTLKEEKLNIQNFFSWNEFSKSIEYLRIPCMTASLAFLSIDLLDAENTSTPKEIWDHLSLNTAPLVLKQYQQVPNYKDRIFDSLMEFYEMLSN